VLVAVALTVVTAGIFVAVYSFQPTRARIAQVRAANCGAYGVGAPIPVRTYAQTAHADALCLQDAWAHCRGATLAFSMGELDITLTDTFVVEPAVLPAQTCQLVDHFTNRGEGNFTASYVCAGLEVTPTELVVQACGSRGVVHAPFNQLTRRGPWTHSLT
jgi:hypothetical protein